MKQSSHKNIHFIALEATQMRENSFKSILTNQSPKNGRKKATLLILWVTCGKISPNEKRGEKMIHVSCR